MLEKFVAGLVEILLNWLLQKTVSAAREYQAELEKQKQQGITNEANVIKYQSAKTREEKIRSSLDLLNRNRS